MIVTSLLVWVFSCTGLIVEAFPEQSSALFEKNKEFTVFTANSNGPVFGSEQCTILEGAPSGNKKLYFEQGIVQLTRDATGSTLSARIKSVLLRGGLSRKRTTISFAFSDSHDEVIFKYSQSLYSDSEYIAISGNDKKFKASNGLIHVNFDVLVHIDLFNLPVSSGTNSSIALTPGESYYFELQILEDAREGRDPGLVECVRVAGVYTGLESDCPPISNASTPTIHNDYITNVYNILASNSSNKVAYNVRDFGAVGDGNTDDTFSIQNSIYAAAESGGEVQFPEGRYYTTSPIYLPSGVTISGQGQGANPRDMSGLLGTVLMYRGYEYALVLEGDLITVQNMAIYDAGINGGTASGGILLNANGRYLESIQFRGVLVYRFTNGTGLKFWADNGGAVTYSSFYDVRIRNAKVGMHLHATGTASSFINSNSFYRGAISGGGFDYGLKLEGPGAVNNNNFYGIVIEPYTSTYGHLYVTGAMSQINGHHIRIEALHQPESTPMIYFSSETYGSSLSGLFSHGLIDVNRLAHDVDIATGKYVGASYSNNNEFSNGGFRGVVPNDGAYGIPEWSLTTIPSSSADMVNISVRNERQIIGEHNVIRILIPPSTSVIFEPANAPQPAVASLYRTASFGMYVRYSDVLMHTHSSVYATFDTSESAVTTSQVHPGDIEWVFVSMIGLIPESASQLSIYPRFYFENTDSTLYTELEVTLPSFSWGEKSPEPESGAIRESGGKMFGTLSTAVVRQTVPPPSSNYYILPKDGNVFIFTSAYTYPTISRINYSGTDRFPEGTVITLLFMVSGVSVSDSVYVNIRSGFTSTSHCSITLLALDSGTWVELGRDGV